MAKPGLAQIDPADADQLDPTANNPWAFVTSGQPVSPWTGGQRPILPTSHPLGPVGAPPRLAAIPLATENTLGSDSF